jgi:hypothetical protein
LRFDGVQVNDGALTVAFTSVVNNAKISAIEVLTNAPGGTLGLDSWVKHTIDDIPYRAVFVDGADFDGDGLKDIVAGGSWYKNPGDVSQAWQENPIGSGLHNMSLVHDFDGDGDPDILGTPGQYTSVAMAWAQNDGGTFTVIDNVPDGTSTHGEPFTAAVATGVFQAGGPFQVALSWNGGENGSSQVEVLSVPANPSTTDWTIGNLHPSSLGEGLSAGDIDDDGDLDLFQGTQWLRNDGASWTPFVIAGPFPGWQVDRNRLVDFDGDGDLDALLGFLQNDTDVVWLEAPDDPTQTWTTHTIASSIGGGLSLHVADFDNDGDPDVAHGEFTGAKRAFIYENLGGGATWQAHTVDAGGTHDHHDGMVPVDIDDDGDLDLLSASWNGLKVWLFENKAID